MQSPNQKLHVTEIGENSGSQASASIWLSLATGPFLLGVIGTKAISESLEAISQASEEIFRGDRLPILHFPSRE